MLKSSSYCAYTSPNGEVCMKGSIYPTKYGYQVRFGRKLTKHFKTRKEAERFLTGIRFKVDEGSFDPRDYQKDNPLGFRVLAEKWLEFKKDRIKPTSFAVLKNYIYHAIDEWGNRNIKTIQYAEIEDFLFKRNDISEKTRHSMASCLNQFFRRLKRRKIISEIPEIPKIPFELAFRNIIDIQTQQIIIDEIYKISWHVNPKIWIGISWLATYVAIRPGELIKIKEKQINLGLKSIIIPHPKEKKPKIISLVNDDIELIKSLPRGMPEMWFFRHPKGIPGVPAGTKFGVHYLWKWWKKACSNLGIDGVDLYGGTRHSTVTALGKICTPEQIKDATGHTSKAFERYFQNKATRALCVTKIIKDMSGQHRQKKEMYQK